jgi:hypothetical protein
MQSNSQVIEAHRRAIQKRSGKMSIHIPICNKIIPEASPQILKEIADCVKYLFIQEIESIDPNYLVQEALRIGKFDNLAQALDAHQDTMECERIEQLIHEGKLQQALERSWDFLISPSESAHLRFYSGLNAIRISGFISVQDQQTDNIEKYLRVRLDVCAHLLRIVRKRHVAGYLRSYACFLARTSRLRVLVEEDHGLFITMSVHARTGDNLMRMVSHTARIQTVIKLLKEFHKTQMSLARMIKANYFHLIPQAWSNMAFDSFAFINRLRQDPNDELAERISSWMDDTGELAIKVAIELKQWSDVTLCARSMASLGDPKDRVKWMGRFSLIRQYIQAIEDIDLKDEAIAELENLANMPFDARQSPSLEEEIAIYRLMAASWGIDPDSPKNNIDLDVQIGLRDLNPERVLRRCKHLFVSPGPYGIAANLLHLKTAGDKILHCTKHGYSYMGRSLDEIHQYLDEQHCRDCHDREPHLAEWKWTRVWQQEQHVIWKRFAVLRNRIP